MGNKNDGMGKHPYPPILLLHASTAALCHIQHRVDLLEDMSNADNSLLIAPMLGPGAGLGNHRERNLVVHHERNNVPSEFGLNANVLKLLR